MVFLKIKVNACILIHPINNCKFFGESFINTLIYLYYIFFLILQVSDSFDYFRSPTVVQFFSYTSFCFLHPIFLGFISDILFHEGHFSSPSLRYLGAVTVKPASMRSHPSKLFQQKLLLFIH
jgi:hypothetical protein